MGLLDQVIGGVVGEVLGGGRGRGGGQGGGQGGGLGGTLGDVLSSPVARALLMLLLTKGAGGLGDLLGGGRAAPEAGRRPPHPSDDGDLGGFGHTAPSGGAPRQEGDFGDLAGMLDGPGDRSPGAGPYAQLDGEPGGREANAGAGAGGLDGLIERFERSGLGDVIGSWIGGGSNHSIAPNRLAEALGPETLDGLGRSTGLSRDDLLNQLSQILPRVVDGLTPQGRRPSEDERRTW